MNVQHTCVLCRPILNVHDVCCIKLVGLKCELTRGVLLYNQYLECPRRMLYIVSGNECDLIYVIYNIDNVCCIQLAHDDDMKMFESDLQEPLTYYDRYTK